MTVTVDQFRDTFPAFEDQSAFPDPDVSSWLSIAYARLPAATWGSNLDLGAQLYAAHELSIERRAKEQASKGAPPGETVGAVSSKGVSSISVGYDTGSTAEERAGYFNQTVYGKRFFRLADAVGSAGITQLGAPGVAGNTDCFW